MPRIKVTLVRSTIGHNTRNRATIKALGLRKVNHSVEKDDSPSVMGMIHSVKELLLVEELGENGESRIVFDARGIKRNANASGSNKKKPNEKHRNGEQSSA